MSNAANPADPTACPVCGPPLLDWLAQSPPLMQRWNALPRLALRRGDTLLRAGACADAVWFVEQGLLRSFFLDAHGRERNHGFYAEAQWLGLPPPAKPSRHGLQALLPSRLRVLSHAELGRWRADEPALAGLLTQALTLDIQRLAERCEQLLMLDAPARYRLFLDQQPDLAARLAQRQIASYLGITEVALSRIRRRTGIRP